VEYAEQGTQTSNVISMSRRAFFAWIIFAFLLGIGATLFVEGWMSYLPYLEDDALPQVIEDE
jgi:hypothetical protein